MTETTAPIEQRLQAFNEACRRAGLRLTHQRQEIFRELALAKDHPSAEGLYQRLRGRFPTISLDTVYRTLATFAAFGVINKVDTVESQGRYEANFERHHHLICSHCKEIMDFQWNSFNLTPLPPEISGWGRVDNANVVVYGICRRCLEAQKG